MADLRPFPPLRPSSVRYTWTDRLWFRLTGRWPERVVAQRLAEIARDEREAQRLAREILRG